MRWHQAHKVYPQLPMKRSTHLPDEGFEPIEVELNDKGEKFHVMCLPKTSRGSKHRVFVLCPCDRMVPFGRMNQHKCWRTLASREYIRPNKEPHTS